MDKKSKHIVILTPGFAADANDTTCIPALQIYAKALAEFPGYDVTVVTLQYPHKRGIYSWNGIPVHSLHGKSVLKIWLWAKTYRTLKQINEQNPIAVLHSFWLGECAFVGHWFSKRHDIKHVTTLMGQDAMTGNRYARILPLKKMRLVSLSPFHSGIFQDNYNIKTRIIPWGIRPEDFTDAEKTIDIIGVGSLIPLKNYDTFIDIVYHLNQSKPVKAILVGEGSQSETLRRKIAALQLQKVIKLRGCLHYHETAVLMSEAKILLHPSHYESFGLVFAEALQARTMIISRNTGCAFPSPNWVVCDCENDMADACKNLLSTAFTDEKNPFTIQETVVEYLNIYGQ